MENLKLAVQIGILVALLFAGYKLYDAFGSLERAEKDIKSALAKIDSAVKKQLICLAVLWIQPARRPKQPMTCWYQRAKI